MGCFDKVLVMIFLGLVLNCIGNIKLFENVFMQIIRSLNLGKKEIVLFVYCLDLEVFWVYFDGGNVFLKYDGENNQFDRFNVEIDCI